MDEPRNLRLLVVDDEIERSIDEVRAFYSARGIDVMKPHEAAAGVASWKDAIAWLSPATEAPERAFDLLLIDVLFLQREDEPQYGGAPLLLNGNPVSPLGLVYGLAILAGRRDPFPAGWAIRSQDAGLIAGDAIAIVSYGLHEALAGSPEDLGARGDGAPSPDLPSERARHVLANGFPSNNMTAMVGPLLRSYRRRLQRAIERDLICVEAMYPTASEAKAWLADRAGDWKKMQDAWVRLRAGRRTEHLKLAAMCADILWPFSRDWDVVRAGEELERESGRLDVYRPGEATELWRRLKACSFDLKAALVDSKHADTVHVTLLFLAAWLKGRQALSRTIGPRDECGLVMSDLGVPKDKRMEGNREYKKILYGVTSTTGRLPKELVQELRDGIWPRCGSPTEPIVREALEFGRRFWFQHLRGREDQMPTAFQPP